MQNLPPTSPTNLTIKSPQAEKFLCLFNPSNNAKYAVHRDRCILGSALTISEVSKQFGKETAESWLSIQLRDLNEFVGVQNKMSVEQIQSLSQSIFYYYPGFKVTEFILFFQMFKMGEFGQFFGSVDSLVLTNALKSFFEYRNGRISHFEAIRRASKRENEIKQMQKDQKEGKTMTYSEFKEIEWLFNM